MDETFFSNNAILHAHVLSWRCLNKTFCRADLFLITAIEYNIITAINYYH